MIATARAAVEERILELDSGADDYFVKPFALCRVMVIALAQRLR